MSIEPLKGTRARTAAVAAAVVALVVSGCKRVEPDAQWCATGFYCPAGTKCAAKERACIVNDCGDGQLQAGEACDDGNLQDRDGCSHDCLSTEVCGNGIKDVLVGEVCDTAAPDGDKCAADCKSTVLCGNGITNEGEACDDAGDTLRCNADCTLARHGDGVTNGAAGEVCDGGVPGGTSTDCQSVACNANCTWSSHGDGIANPDTGEQCDGNNLGSGNGKNCESPFCNADCTWSRHGDGIQNPLAGEQCDGGIPGGDSPNCQSASCNADCTLSRHGDGIVNSLHDSEQCDGGALGGSSPNCESASCNWNCTPASCGDSVVNATRGEECDDGNLASNDDCKACKLTFCGDGIPNVSGPLHAEVCDLGTALNGRTSCTYGLTSCDGCAVDCQSRLPTVAHYCGDFVPETGQVDASGGVHDEQCDDSRSFACGTCKAGACTTVPTAKARGRIEVKDVSVRDGTVLTLGDRTTTFTIEIDMNGDQCSTSPNTQPTGCARVTNAAPEPKHVAGAIRSEITRLHDLGRIPLHLRSTNNDQYVKLEHDDEGTIGNRIITASPPSTSLAFLDMSGGVGCALDEACAADADCVSGTCAGTPSVCH